MSVLVTGGASFIGSHLVDALVARGESVNVIDDFSSGKLSNLSKSGDSIKLYEGSVRNKELFREALDGVDTLYHLAAIHGGRGYIEAYPQKMMENLALDYDVFSEATEKGVLRVVHASSACAYPVSLQDDESGRGLLREDEANFEIQGSAYPDGAYGWTKLMGEYQLAQMCKKSTTTGRSARIFTAYGSRENESHAAIALIAKALLRLDPYPIWGNGLQTRNFTHVFDTVRGLIALGDDKSSESFRSVNVGNSVHYTVIDFVNEVLRQVGWEPEKFDFQLDKPTGVKSRAASNELMLELTGGWEPSIGLQEGIHETLSWYVENIFGEIDKAVLEQRLVAR